VTTTETDAPTAWLVEGRPPGKCRRDNIAGILTSVERPGWLTNVVLDDGRSLRVCAVDMTPEEIARCTKVVCEVCARHGLLSNILAWTDSLGVTGFSASLHLPPGAPWERLGDRVVNHPGHSTRWKTSNGTPLADDEVDPYISEFLSRHQHNRNPLDVYQAMRRSLRRPLDPELT
jgi:hypothetical protein